MKTKQQEEGTSSKKAPKAKSQQPQMVHEPSNDTERFFNKYVEARYYANLKKEIYTERRIELKEDEFLEEQQVFEDKGWN